MIHILYPYLVSEHLAKSIKHDLDRKIVQKEIEVLQKLRYRHIIQFYRTHEEGDCIYLLMELAEKGSLAHAINKGEIAHDDWTTKMRLAHEMAQGLAYIHQEKVFHRDLKSANVLLTKNMEVRLGDFGMAQVRSAVGTASSGGGSASGRPAGTLRWVAPELLFVDTPKYSAKSDVYALGMVMWEIAADCTRPFKEQNDDMLVTHSVKDGRRERLPDDTPPEYRKWVESCWEQDPDRRPNASDVAKVYDESNEEDCSTDVGFLELDDSTRPGGSLVNEDSHDNVEQHTKAHDHDSPVGYFPETDDEVVSYFCSAAKGENADAQLFLGWIFQHGRGVEKNEQASLRWYRQAADGGNAVAQLRIARMYEKGLGVEVSDDTKAVRWYYKAATGGNADAGLALAKMYTDGRGVKEDAVQAARWYRMAAEKGQHEAQAILGQWYSLGRGVIQNDVEAARWLFQAAVHGDVAAQRNLGKMYLQGRGIQLSDISDKKWYTKITDRMKYSGGKGTVQSDVEAVKWYTRAAEQGDEDAQNTLGWMYWRGRGVDQNDIEAVKWFTKAAEQESGIAQFNLGRMHSLGRGIAQCDAEAIKWYTRAAEQGNALAQFHLGRMYSQGRRTEQSEIEAVKWFTMAAEQGDTNAQIYLGMMYSQGRGVEQSDTEADKWFTRAAK
ncbi:hypothetical protein BGZ73_007195 [Actinomortierella ambigua]|nr:hypothetical protein BGZ73_007195 [Actinomortierella ambigua]